MKRIIVCLGLLLSLMPLLVAQAETSTKKVAILEVVDRDNTINYGVRLLLRTTLAKTITQTPGYEGYDRVDMGAIQGEQDFQRTGMVSDEQIKRLGEMTGAAYVLVAEAAKIDAATMIVTAKILDVETAKLERTDYEQMGMDAQKIADGCRAMADRLFVTSGTINQKNTVGEVQKNGIILSSGSKVVHKGANAFIEDEYMVRTKMTQAEIQTYFGKYYRSWLDAKKQQNAGIALLSVGGAAAVTGSVLLGVGKDYHWDYDWRYDYYYYYDDENYMIIGGCALGVGIGLLIAGIPTYVKACKKMDGIVRAVNEQHGIAPYRTEVSFNLGNQQHGIGLGLRF